MLTRLNPFRRLRGKMTLTYTAVTGGVFFLLWLLLLGLVVSLNDLPVGTPASAPVFDAVVQDITPFLRQSPPDRAELQAYLDLWVSGDNLRIESDSGGMQAVYNDLRYVAVTAADGTLLAVEPQVFPAQQTTLPLPESVAAAYAPVRQGQTAYRNVAAVSGDEALSYNLAALPDGLGGLVVVFGPEAVDGSIRQELVGVTLAMSVVLLCGTAVMGTLFGWLASAGLVRRLRRVQATAATWAEGDLSPRVRDRSADELGQLGRDLNQMAQQLDSLMAARSGLAAVEERNRLARDLHDTVKQQIFAASMQLSSARALIHDDPAAADRILGEVEALTDQVQTELTGLIAALRPAALADQGLAAALREYVAAWSKRSGVAVEVVVQGERPLPLAIEQELYRVAQEALANVAKHAQAMQVVVGLNWQPRALTLEIRDDGIGFDGSQPADGFGLESMNARLAALHGLVTVDSQPGAGTRVTAVVELPDE